MIRMSIIGSEFISNNRCEINYNRIIRDMTIVIHALLKSSLQLLTIELFTSGFAQKPMERMYPSVININVIASLARQFSNATDINGTTAPPQCLYTDAGKRSVMMRH